MSVKVYGNLVTGCHDCPFLGVHIAWSSEEGDINLFKCNLRKIDNILDDCNEKFVNNKIVDPICPMLQEETHSITIMLSDQYNKSNG